MKIMELIGHSLNIYCKFTNGTLYWWFS